MLCKTHSHETVLNTANHLVFMWKNRRRKNQHYQNLDESFYSFQFGKVGKKPRSGGKTGSFLHRNQVEEGEIHYLRGQKLSGGGSEEASRHQGAHSTSDTVKENKDATVILERHKQYESK